MILRVPKYYKLFNCLAGKCIHSCCSNGWEIDVDNNTYNYYKSANSSILEHITKSSPHQIIMKNGICPFFNSNKLCDIYIDIGEEHMCDICKNHPRFYEWFEDLKEGGIGLCCEEAARIILTDTSAFETYNEKIPVEKSNAYDKKLFDFLEKCRKKLFELFDSSLSLNEKIRTAIVFSCDIEQAINSNNYIVPEFEDVQGKRNIDYSSIINYLLSLEIFNKDWQDTLQSTLNGLSAKDEIINSSDFEKSMNSMISNELESDTDIASKIDFYLNNIAKYFIWRYFLKATFDENVYSKIVLLAISVLSIKILLENFESKNKTISIDDIIDIVRRFSEEIEYSENNINTIFSDSYYNTLFSADSLINYFS